jgi:hypothetical protein
LPIQAIAYITTESNGTASAFAHEEDGMILLVIHAGSGLAETA